MRLSSPVPLQGLARKRSDPPPCPPLLRGQASARDREAPPEPGRATAERRSRPPPPPRRRLARLLLHSHVGVPLEGVVDVLHHPLHQHRHLLRGLGHLPSPPPRCRPPPLLSHRRRRRLIGRPGKAKRIRVSGPAGRSAVLGEPARLPRKRRLLLLSSGTAPSKRGARG